MADKSEEKNNSGEPSVEEIPPTLPEVVTNTTPTLPENDELSLTDTTPTLPDVEPITVQEIQLPVVQGTIDTEDVIPSVKGSLLPVVQGTVTNGPPVVKGSVINDIPVIKGTVTNERPFSLWDSIKNAIKKISTSDVTVMAIYFYLSIIFVLYILIGFILTNCVFDNAKRVFNLITGITNNIIFPTTKVPTKQQCVMPTTKASSQIPIARPIVRPGIIKPIKGIKERGCILSRLSSQVSKLNAKIASKVISLSKRTLIKLK
jgi:hypothetical protein